MTLILDADAAIRLSVDDLNVVATSMQDYIERIAQALGERIQGESGCD